VKSRMLLLAILAGLTGLFFALGLHRYLTLEVMQASLGNLKALYAGHPLLMLGGYFLAYVLMAAMSFPGATIMGVAGGAVFGLTVATLAVSFASTIGATLAFLSSRYLLRDFVQRKFHERLGAVNDGIRTDGAWYLLSMRLVPVLPFFVINLVMGLTPMRVRTYYLVSQLGMLPGTMVYVNAGKELAGLTSLSGILSPSMLVAFVLLGIFPLLAKKVVLAIRGRREN